MFKYFTRSTLIACITVALILSYFINLHVVELRGEEPRRAVVAMEMYAKGDLIVPRINGYPYYNKPPLFNWVLIFFFSIFSSFNEWVVRLPSIIALLLMGFATYWFGKKYISKEAGVLAAFFLLTSADIYFYGAATSGEIDLFFSLLVLVQVGAIFYFEHRKQYWQLFLISYLFAALGILTKGFPSIFFQVCTLAGWLWFTKKLRWLISIQHLAGIGLGMLIIGTYFYAYSLKGNVAFFITNLIKETVQKSALASDENETIKKFFIFPFEVMKFLLPWSVILLLLFSKQLQRTLPNRLIMFCLLFIAVNIPFYWVTGEARSRYLYMFFPFVALIIAHLYQRILPSNKLYNILRLVFGVVLVLLPVGMVAGVIIFKNDIGPILKIISIILAISLAFTAYAYFRFKRAHVYFLVLALVLLRVGYAAIYYPVFDKVSNELLYKEHVQQINTLLKGQSLFFYGKKDTIVVVKNLRFLMDTNEQIIVPPLLPYQIPYYVGKNNNGILQYDSLLNDNRIYIAYEEAVQSPVNVYYKFTESFLHKPMIVFSTKK